MDKCTKCQNLIEKLQHMTPLGWVPFGWSPQTEIPEHFYVFSEDTPEPEPGIPQELDLTKLCEVPNPRSRLPMRVDVWNGDRSTYLGRGTYEENVTVYVVEDEEGVLHSHHNAEEKLEVPGAPARGIKNNPKIILDDGNIVYGCQVWWTSIEEGILRPSKGGK